MKRKELIEEIETTYGVYAVQIHGDNEFIATASENQESNGYSLSYSRDGENNYKEDVYETTEELLIAMLAFASLEEWKTCEHD